MDSGSETEEPGIPKALVDGLQEAEAVLGALAGIFYPSDSAREPNLSAVPGTTLPELEVRYKTLLEQIPAVVFMAPLEAGLSSAHVSPHIEAVLGFTQEQWLNDPVRWYYQIHPDDRGRWSIEATAFPDGTTGALRVSPDGAGWAFGLVSMRSENGAKAGWTALVYSRRGFRHQRPQKRAGILAASAR